MFIEVSEEHNFYAEQPVTLPDDVVEGSVKIRISVVGMSYLLTNALPLIRDCRRHWERSR